MLQVKWCLRMSATSTFPFLLKALVERLQAGNVRVNLLSGFRKTDIFSVNWQKVLECLSSANSVVAAESSDASLYSCFLKCDKIGERNKQDLENQHPKNKAKYCIRTVYKSTRAIWKQWWNSQFLNLLMNLKLIQLNPPTLESDMTNQRQNHSL